MAEPTESKLLIDTRKPPKDPDVMNDPQYATNTPGGEDGAAEQCRICRVEGSTKEPLFHPCKCSGSIKHVHQDCLMEWLSHSQKKHCELCKTPFRFTKLYSPNMPQTLPTGVFLQHSLLHMARNLATWLRGCLVVTVWLGCLPYIIRQVWRLLFWFSDGGWPSQYLERIDPSRNASIMHGEMARQLQESLAANGTSLRVPWLAAQTTPASVGVIMGKFLPLLDAVSQNLNISAVDPLLTGFVKSIYYGLGIQDSSLSGRTSENDTAQQFIINFSPAARSPSLLSEVFFLKNLTRYNYVNQLIITIAEGYVITILVVVCFILVFLIREWVVQQQPNINMGAGFNAEIGALDALRQRGDAAGQGGEDDGVNRLAENGAVGQRPMARPRRAPRPRNIPIHIDGEHDQVPPPANIPTPNRPAVIRDASTSLIEVQRQLTEEPRMTEEFLAIWRRADGNPEEVLQIIWRENKSEEMSYWVNAMNLLLETSQVRNGNSNDRSHIEQEGAQLPLDTQLPSTSASDKGKGKATEVIDESQVDFRSQRLPDLLAPTSQSKSDEYAHDGVAFVPSSTSNIARPRAISDGPQLRNSISPLANNNWSFMDLPDDKENINPALIGSANESRAYTAPVLTGDNSDINNQDTKAKDLQDSKIISAAQSQVLLQPQVAMFSDKENPTEKDNIHSRSLTSTNSGLQFENPIEILSLSGSVRPLPSVDSNPAEQTDEDEDEYPIIEREQAVDNPFAPDTPLPPPREPVALRVVEPQGIFANLADWLWGGVEANLEEREDEDVNDEHIVEDLAAEAPFVPVAHNDPFGQIGNFVDQDREVVEAAMAAGIDPNDPDAEDAEDFEGIMELIGMRGPIISLVQNALFSALLLALTVFFGVWIPYNIGRASLLLTANPGTTLKLPLRLLFWCAALIQDLVAFCLGAISHSIIIVLSRLSSMFLPVSSFSGGLKWASWSYRLSREAVDRIMEATFGGLVNFSDSDIFVFSAASHESLLTLQYLFTDTFEAIGSNVVFLFTGDYKLTVSSVSEWVLELLKLEWHLVSNLPAYLAKPDSWVISLGVAKRVTPLDLELSVWGGWDRFWATFGGYTALGLLGAAYVKKGAPFSTGQGGREWEATVVDLLNQAGGVMKVILIISIEMLVFPLYCGLLLDAALLPLFDNATLVSRILFTFESPLTSIFIHWFVGTCYMFHFALFVSMCRKIMRKGVLYFIRDPDDPTFHPVRDVLERNVATQLRKILFSALVYGALVVICLGGVVWGLAYTFKGVLPIHWSSNEPVLEFPIDLLFYNFLMPLAVKFFRPSDGLHAVYAWWFRQCARMLRLTWFMFDERKEDEEGHIVRRSFMDIFRGLRREPLAVLAVDDPNLPFIKEPGLREYIRQDGRYVRAPASDQVRVKKGTPIFLQVDEQNNRIPGQPIRPLRDVDWDSDLYKQVYIPPYFRARIFAFIISIWLFAAFTGVCITIVPLVFGRHVFGKIIPNTVRKNDVYAFSIGIYILGSAVYTIIHLRQFVNYLRASFAFTAETPANVLRRATAIASRVARIVWVYSAVLFLLPTLFAFFVEFYTILPLHTYISPKETHTIHFVQSWTLGLLYVKLTTRLIHFYPESRPAASLRLILRDGYLNPDTGLATRFFIVPATLGLVAALGFPWLVAQGAILTFLKNSSEHNKMLIFRFVYPSVLGFAGSVYLVYLGLKAVTGWKMKIKDEVYLIGERLHNFGERKVASPNTTAGGSLPVRRLET